MLDEHQITELIQRFYAFELEDENRLRLSTGVQFDEANRRAAVSYFQRLGLDVKEALARNELQRANQWVDALLEREGFDAEIDAVSRARLQQGVLRASCEVAEAMRKRFEGDFNHTPADGVLVASTPPNPNREGATKSPAKPKKDASGFTVEAEQFRLARVRRGVWDPQTALQARKTYELFVELCGDRPIAGYVREDAVQFKNLLSDLPAVYGKAPKYRGMQAKDVVLASLDSGEPRLSARTVQRHLSALASLWGDRIEAGEVPGNIFANFKLPSGKRPQDQRPMWSTDKLRELFDSPIWRGCKSTERRSQRGPHVIRDERFWLPLIALFSGMRQEEICQLQLADIRQESGHWVFDVNDVPPRQLKNRNGVRLVPIHEQLIALDLLEHAEQLRTTGAERLFPTMSRGGADSRLGHNYSKWFTRYRKDIGLYEKGLDFHSFRHSATTFLAHGGVSGPIIDKLTGHATAGETARYTKSFRIEQLSESINRLDPGLDLSFLTSGAKVRGIENGQL